MTNIDDKIKTLLLKGKKEKAFNLILSQYKEKLYWQIRRIIISHHDTDDVLQNTFIKIWNNIDNFRGDSKLFTWLYRIATNESLAFLDLKKRKSFFTGSNNDIKLANYLESDVYFDGNEIQKKLQKALLQLPEKQRLVFNMKYFDDLKFSEISEILGTSTGALKASYHIAIKKIKEFLNNN